MLNLLLMWGLSGLLGGIVKDDDEDDGGDWLMNNTDFIKKYGKFEFYEMCKCISQDLAIAKAMKKIGGYKVSNNKKRVKFYRKDKYSVYVDFATIFTLGTDKLKNYIEGK